MAAFECCLAQQAFAAEVYDAAEHLEASGLPEGVFKAPAPAAQMHTQAMRLQDEYETCHTGEWQEGDHDGEGGWRGLQFDRRHLSLLHIS